MPALNDDIYNENWMILNRKAMGDSTKTNIRSSFTVWCIARCWRFVPFSPSQKIVHTKNSFPFQVGAYSISALFRLWATISGETYFRWCDRLDGASLDPFKCKLLNCAEMSKNHQLKRVSHRNGFTGNYLDPDWMFVTAGWVGAKGVHLLPTSGPDAQPNCSHVLPDVHSPNAIDANRSAMTQLKIIIHKIVSILGHDLDQSSLYNVVKGNENVEYLLSKCCACSIRNWDPCSHCRSNNCSKLCGVFPLAVGVPVPPSIELSEGPCGWLCTLFLACESNGYMCHCWFNESNGKKSTNVIQLFAGEDWANQCCSRIHAGRCVHTVRLQFHVQLIRHFLCDTAGRIQLIAQHVCRLLKHFHLFRIVASATSSAATATTGRRMISFQWIGFRTGRTWRRVFDIGSRCDSRRFIVVRLGLVRNFQIRKWVRIVIRRTIWNGCSWNVCWFGNRLKMSAIYLVIRPWLSSCKWVAVCLMLFACLS